MAESNYSNGRKYESEVKKELEGKGYIVFKPPWVRYSKQMDVFNIFDLLAYNPETNDMQMLQLTTSLQNSKWNERAEKVEGFNLKTITVACIQKGGQKLEKKYVVSSEL